MLVGDILRESAERTPDRLALVGRHQRLTYAEFDEQANRLANASLDLRLARGAKVAMLSSNCPAYAIGYFAISRTPYVSVHCSTRSVPSELVFVLRKTEAEVLLFESGFSATVAAALQELDQPTGLIVLDDPDRQWNQLANSVPLQEFISGASASTPKVSLHESDPLAITMTGGTTGLPKGVLVSHAARCASAVAAARDFGLDQNDIVVASTPLFHAAGLFVWFGTAVMLGATVVMLDEWDPVGFMQLVAKEEITAAFLVPSQLNELIGYPGLSVKPLRTLCNIGYAGAPMGHAVAERMRSALPHVSFTENYGQSEACPISIRCAGDGENKRDTVGRAACNAEIAIVDKEGKHLPPGEVGEIVTRGEQLFTEYFNDPEETSKALSLPDGWLLTGDVGYLDEDGFLTLVERSKDMLVSGGENVYPAEIENVIYRHDAVAECAVFGIPDERWGEVPAAYVVLSPGRMVTSDELIEFCVSQIARFKRPRLVKFVDSLPKTAIGKIQKNKLREPYWTRHEKKI
jgi:acyl-CoA synthetase (AMP-forming)/AMP-acid ligase II